MTSKTPRRLGVQATVVAVSALLALSALGFGTQLSAAPGPVSDARAWVTASLERVSQVPIVQSLQRRIAPAQAQAPTGGGSQPTVQTDKADYAPGETVIVTGTGWLPNSSIELLFRQIADRPDHAAVTLWTESDENGTIDTSRPSSSNDDYVLEPSDLGATYQLRASGPTMPGGTPGIALTTFTDNIKVDFKQCANKDQTLGTCHFINSILQSSNSRIFEGMSTLQRLIFSEIPAPVAGSNNKFRLNFHMDAFKASSAAHAYDFLTTWDQAKEFNDQLSPLQDLYPDDIATNVARVCGAEIPTSGSNPTLQQVCTSLFTNGSKAYASHPTITSPPVVGGNVQAALNAYQARYGAGGLDNNRAMTIYTNQPITNVVLAFVQYDPQGNSRWSLTWDSTGTPAVPVTQMMVLFGAHVAVGVDPFAVAGTTPPDDVGYGQGKGAASISGAPFHVSIDLFDNQCNAGAGNSCGGSNGGKDDISLGSQDNQLSNDILIPARLPQVTTQVHNAAHTDVTNATLSIGAIVHDSASIDTGSALNLIPSGSTLDFNLWSGGTCGVGGGSVISSALGVAVTGGGQTASVDNQLSFTTTAAGSFSYKVDFHSGDTGVVLDASAACEPFTVKKNPTDVSTSLSSTGIGASGSVHDATTLTGLTSDAGGTVTYTIYVDNACGTQAASPAITGTNPQTVTVANGVVPNAQDVTFNTPGLYYWVASYSGDANNEAVTDGCADEPLLVADASIGITPATDVNPVGTNHTLTITVNALPAGSSISAGTATATLTGAGSFVDPPGASCSYTAGASPRTCTVVITSSLAGISTVSASSGITVTNSGLSATVTRSTNGSTTAGGLTNDSPATKTWASATIAIAPSAATNVVGTPHTLTITVSAAGANIGAGTATATLTGAGSFVDPPGSSCSYTAGASPRTCIVVIQSNTTGVSTVSASSNIPIQGDGTIAASTSGTAGSATGPALKNWVDAAIAITPPSAVNAVGTTHTLTISVSSAPAGSTISGGTATATITGAGTFVGGLTTATCQYGAGTSPQTCTVAITSAVAGISTVSATSGIAVTSGGLSATATRSTDGNLTVSGLQNSGNATKNWASAAIAIAPANATNAVGTNHVLTITVTAAGANIGSGTATATITGAGTFLGGGTTATCGYGPGASPQTCTVTITSTGVGTSTVSASSNIPIQGDGSIPASTNGAAGTATAPALKNWVDAAIAINPPSATNPVGTTHTLTISVSSAPAGSTISGGTATATITGAGTFVGGLTTATCQYGAGTSPQTCTVAITSAVAGISTVSATSGITVTSGGLSATMTRITNGQQTPSGLNNSNPATKTWVSQQIAQIAPTATTCQDFKNGTAADLTQIQYSLQGNLINQVNPGVFFYWMKVTGGGTYTITQSDNGTTPAFAIASGSAVFNSNCNKNNGATLTQNADGSVTITFAGTGDFFIGVKYSSGSVVGSTAPNPTTVNYVFSMVLGGQTVPGSTDGVDLVLKP